MDLQANLLPETKQGKNGAKLLYIVIPGTLFIILLTTALLLLFQFNHGVKLVGLKPDGEIDPKTNLIFVFSADIARPDSIGDTFDGDFIRFSPDIPGKFRFISKRELCFLPEVPFRSSAKYKAEFKANPGNLKGKYGRARLSGKRTVEFRTYRFKVEHVNISFNYLAEQKKGIQMQARLYFNYPVSPEELQKSLKLRFADFGKEIQYNLNTNEISRQVSLISEPLYPGDQDLKIEFSLPAGFRCVGGELGLEKSYVMVTNLSARRDLGVLEAMARTDSARCRISVRLSEPVDPEAVAGYIRLKPEVPFKVEVDGECIDIKSEQFNPGESCTLSLASGLPALNGNPLKHDYTKTVIFHDLEPSLKFNFAGRYLQAKDITSLSLETVNIGKVNLEISQISAGDIVAYFNSMNGEEYFNRSQAVSFGKNIQSSLLTLSDAGNQTIITPVNPLEVDAQKFKGLLQVVAYDNDNRWRQDSKYVIITDLGLVAKMSSTGLMVWVNSLETTRPKAKVKVSIISKTNQILAALYTDAQGIVRFTQMKNDSAAFEPFIVLAELGHDFAFLYLPDSRISMAGFDIEGRARSNEGGQAFLYMDRNIFHPGDKGNLVAVVRDPNTATPTDTQVKLVIRQPDGRLFKEFNGNTRDRGACEFAITIPDYARTGKYNADLFIADRVVGGTVFNVEEFMTERVKISADTDKAEYAPGDIANIKIKGVNLLGPAVGSKVKLKVKVEPETFTPQDLSSFTFGDPGRNFLSLEEDLGEKNFNSSAVADYHYIFPRQAAPPAALKVTFQAVMVQDGGRTVSCDKTVTYHPYDCYIGIKPETGVHTENSRPYKLKYVVADLQGKLIAKPSLLINVYHIIRNTVYRKNSDGHYDFQTEEEKEKVFSGAVEAFAGENSFQFTPRDYGRFLIVMADPRGMARASYNFYVNSPRADAGDSAWEMENPEKIQLTGDRKVYQVGDLAQIQIKAPFSGKALVSVEREKVYDYRIVEFKENAGVVTIPVREEYKPNVYISVDLIRPQNAVETNAPLRAFGVIPLMVDCSGRKLALEIDSLTEVRPGRLMEVSLKVNGALKQSARDSYVTLAAVDEGICRITNLPTPSPWDYFYGKRSLNVGWYDFYGVDLPEVIKNKNSSRESTSESVTGGPMNLNPVSVKGVKPVSLWSGLIKLNSQGMAKVKFYIPQFNGALRLMAVAHSGGSFGTAGKTVIVNEPIVLTPAFPRFVAPKDQFTVPVSVYNRTGKPGTFGLRLFPGGPVEFKSQAELAVDIDNNTEKMVFFKLKAKNATGKLHFRLQAKGNDEITEINADLPLRPAAPLTDKIYAGVIDAENPLNLSLEHKWIPEATEYSLTLAPFPSVQYSSSLGYLWEYPYNGVEQIASKIFPLLYFNELAQSLHEELFKGNKPNSSLNQAIAKLESMQLEDGSFTYWPGGTLCNEWSSIYAAHCLIEARKAGLKISPQVYNKSLVFLQLVSKNNDTKKDHLQTKIYALYTLSLAGKPLKSMMAFLKNHNLEEMGDDSRAQLAAAYFYTGDRKTAQELLPAVSTGLSYTVNRETGGNLNSPVRTDAIILGAYAEIAPTNPAVPILLNRLSKEAETGFWATTQENAFALIALSKVLNKKREGVYHGEVIAGSTKIATFSSKKFLGLKDPRLGLGPLTVHITGDRECFYYLKARGVPHQEAVGRNEHDNGISVRRRILDRRGEIVDPGSIKQGDLLIAEITIQTKQDNLANIAVEDRLSGGLEIENPRLVNIAGLPWLDKNTLHPDYMEAGDDRLELFLTILKTGIYKYYYTMRAVTCGKFTLPPVKAGCMYEPGISSVALGGEITVNE